MSQRRKVGLVLSGGGARGAYEAGILRYICKELPQNIRSKIRYDIICGTSVGAINGCFLAANAQNPEQQGEGLAAVWERLRIEGVYHFGWKELARLPKFLWGNKDAGSKDASKSDELLMRLGGLFNSAPLDQLVRRGLRWRSIEENCQAGHFDALAVNATHIATGKTHTFVHTNVQNLEATEQLAIWSKNPHLEVKTVVMGPAHALASAAIPWIFPSVEIDGDVYCDGSLKLNTPITPALRLGAERLLVLGLKHPESEAELLERSAERIAHFPSAFFLLGKVLSALMLDRTEHELRRIRNFNEILAAGRQAYGPDFGDILGKNMPRRGGKPYRHIDTLYIRPSSDIAEIAAKQVLEGDAADRAPNMVGRILRRIAQAEGRDSDVLSYLLFDGPYASALIQMGMHDADAMRARLIEFFREDVGG